MIKESKDSSEFNNLRREFDTIKQAITKISKQGISESSRENIKDVVSEITDDLNDFIGEKKESFLDLLSKGKHNFSGTKDKCEKHIKSNPFLSMLGAMAVGTLIGIIIKK